MTRGTMIGESCPMLSNALPRLACARTSGPIVKYLAFNSAARLFETAA
jgi:hypothetical protein